MRKLFVLTALAVGAAAAVAPYGGAERSAPMLRGTCATTTGLDIYFWPQGHPAVPALGFPAFGEPHVELYRGHDVSNAGAFGYLDPKTYALARTCNGVADTAMAALAAGSPTTSTQTKVRCTFSGNVDIRLADLNRVTTKIVKKTITVKVRVKGKLVKRKKVVKRPVRTVAKIGVQATVAAAGVPGTLARVVMSATPSVQWSASQCAEVPLTS